MGLIKPTLSVSASGGSMEIAFIERYNELQEIANGGYDDILGEPILIDTTNDGIGERVLPVVPVSIKCKVKFASLDRQDRDDMGNTPSSNLVLTFFEEDLITLGLLVNGVSLLKPNDRLIKIQRSDGSTRVDFTSGGREGLVCTEIIPGETGSRTVFGLFEARKQV